MSFRVADSPVRALGAPTARVLVVDDNEQVLGVFARILRRAGYAVLLATNALDALDIVAGDGPDLLVTDVLMRGMDGLELLQRVRRIAPDLPVIVVSGYPTDSSRETALARGAIAYFPKPVDVPVFRQSVAHGLEMRRERSGATRDPEVDAR